MLERLQWKAKGEPAEKAGSTQTKYTGEVGIIAHRWYTSGKKEKQSREGGGSETRRGSGAKIKQETWPNADEIWYGWQNNPTDFYRLFSVLTLWHTAASCGYQQNTMRRTKVYVQSCWNKYIFIPHAFVLEIRINTVQHADRLVTNNRFDLPAV